MYLMNNIEKELINEKLNGVYKAIEANAEVQSLFNKNLMESLTRIEAKVTLTNGSVARANEEIANNRMLFEKEIQELRLKNATHYEICPMRPKVEKVEKKLIYYTGIIIGILFAIEIILKVYF